MKAFCVMFVVFAVLLLAAPMASAHDGWPGCPWGDTYSPTEHGFIAECFWPPAAHAAAGKPAGLAAPAPTQAQGQFGPCSAGEYPDPLTLACPTQPVPAAQAAAKPAGLAKPAPAAVQEQGWSCLSWRDAYDPMTHAYFQECVSRPADNAAAPKTAGLAQMVPATATNQGLLGCPGGSAYDVTGHGCVAGYLNGAAATGSSTPKAAGLAAPVPVQEQFGPCSAGENPDPLALACPTQSVPAAKAASKPAGLAAPALTAEQNQDGLGCPPGYFYFVVRLGYPGECFAKAVSTVSAAPKSAGLAQPAPALTAEQNQDGMGCPPGYFYFVVRPGYPGECFAKAVSTVSAAPKSAGLAKLGSSAPQDVTKPCGAGESPDPLALPLACLR